MDPPAPPAIPAAALQERLDALRREARSLPTGSDDWRVDAQRAYLDAARVLLEAATQPDTSEAASLAGLTLADQRQTAAAWIASAPASPPEAWLPHVAALARPVPTPGFDGPQAVTNYTRQRLAPLLAIVWLKEPEALVGSAWPPTPAPPTDLSPLTERASALILPPHVREPLGSLLNGLTRAGRFPEYLPFTDEVHRDLAMAVGLLESLQRAAWLDASTRQAVHDELARVLTDYADVVARPRASQRLAELRAIGWILDDAAAWRQQRDAARLVETMAPRMIRTQLADVGAAPRRAVMSWYRRVRAAVDESAGLTPPQHQAMRLAHLQVERELGTAMEAVLAASSVLAANPAAISTPPVTEALQTLWRRSQGLAAIGGLTAALEQIDGYRPNPPMGVRQRLIREVEAVRDPAQRDAALHRIGMLVRQARRYATLPGEAGLRGAGEAGPLLSGRSEKLLAAMDAARSAWATAWAGGQPPDAAESAIEPLRMLLALATRARPSGVSPGWTLAPSMDAWAGWQSGETAMRSLFGPLDQSVESLLDAAGRGDREAVEQGIVRMYEESALALAVLQLAEGPTHGPAGLAGALAQVLLSPGPEAYMADHREPLATLNRLVVEWPLADEGQRADLRLRGMDVIRRLRRDLPPLE